MNARLFRTIAWALLWLLCCVGCSKPGPTMGQVVFDDGSPVAAGSIEFRNVDGGALFASRIQGGWFQPEDKDGTVGLPPGDYE
ncbi:MAG: carboxypeptidase regulatory-like domain-containing protein, partial [Planctomycetota bacterium]